jgi:eukaryotic-like serine/threonine-protein kinase
MALTAGERIGPYEMVEPIGAGGMGEVWKARDTRLGRIVAIKRLKGQHGARFEREARAVAALNHPNICQIHDVGPDYLVLEYIDGKPLAGPVPVPEAVRLAIQIASALEEAHGRGILHRDLKPANIMVTGKRMAKLLDFGLARFADVPASDVTTFDGTLTGTPAYMSPEQASGKPLDERSDIFSFGAVVYELVSGKRAFGGASAAEAMSSVLRDEPEPLHVSAALTEIAMRCLRKSPAERFQTVAEVRGALESISGKQVELQPSIAVLPFANMSRDADDEYFSDGLAEEILNVLSHIPGLKVTARTSSFAFRGKEQDVRKVAEALGVRTILEGSVRRAGSRIRVTAQLINAADGYHLWSERFDRELTDVFAVQDEIAAAITGVLQIKLTGEPATALPHEPNLSAWEAFLKGRNQYFKYSPEAFARAEDYYKQAIALDPLWASAHSSLGWLYFSGLGTFGLRPIREVVPLARAAARKALELLPSDPMAHVVLGSLAALHDYDWNEAEEQFRLVRAPDFSPPEVHSLYATNYLLPLGRFEEAIREGAKAIAQDPLNVRWRGAQAFSLLCAERYEPAIAEARKALELDDKTFTPHLAMAWSYALQRKPAEARAAVEEAVRISPWHPMAAGLLAGLLAQAGEKEEAEKLIAVMSGMIPAGMMAYHFIRSEIDAAIDWYERDIELRQPGAAMTAAAGFLRPLRASPRWPKLAKMMNLPAKV